MTTDILHTLGRERIPGRPGEGGRTIVSAIGDDATHPLPCPRCAAPPPDGPGTRALLDADAHGTASCRACGLVLPRMLAPLDAEQGTP